MDTDFRLPRFSGVPLPLIGSIDHFVGPRMDWPPLSPRTPGITRRRSFSFSAMQININ